MSGMLDYVGAKEIVGGAGIAEIIGAVSKEVINQLADVRAAGGVGVIEKEGSKKIKPLPFSTASVATTASGTVNCTAQELYRPSRLVIQDAANWVVTNLTITTKQQSAAAGTIPGNIFAFNAWGVQVEFDTIPVGGTATMTATNTSGGTLTLYSAFVGVSIG